MTWHSIGFLGSYLEWHTSKTLLSPVIILYIISFIILILRFSTVWPLRYRTHFISSKTRINDLLRRLLTVFCITWRTNSSKETRINDLLYCTVLYFLLCVIDHDSSFLWLGLGFFFKRSLLVVLPVQHYFVSSIHRRAYCHMCRGYGK